MYKREVYYLAAYGVTLIELMTSLTLCVLLLGAAAGIYLALENQYRGQSSLTEIQQHRHVVLQSLYRELKLAGFIGCSRFTANFPFNNKTPYVFNAANALEWQRDRAGSFKLIIRHRSVLSQFLQQPMQENSLIVLPNDFPIKRGEILLIADCKHADLFQVAQVFHAKYQQQIVPRSPLQYRYTEDAEVGHFEVNTYWIDKTHYQNERGEFASALYRMDLAGHKVMLIEGVQSFIIQAYQRGLREGISIQLESGQNKLPHKSYLFVALDHRE